MALAVLTAVLCLSSCGGIKKLEDLKITSANISGITASKLRGAGLVLEIGVDNPGTQVTLSDISCNLERFGKVLGMVTVDPFTIEAKTEKIYTIKADIALGQGMSLMDMRLFLDENALNEMTADIKARVQLKGGASKNLVFNDIPLKKLIETAKNEK